MDDSTYWLNGRMAEVEISPYPVRKRAGAVPSYVEGDSGPHDV